MATRRWFRDLATWMRQEGVSKDEVARGSGHKAAHVLELFGAAEPNPSLQLYLDVLTAAGARFAGVEENTPRAVLQHLRGLMDERDITMSGLARLADVNRSQISTLFNDPDPNPKLAIIDRLVEALDATDGFELVATDAASEADEDEDQNEDDDSDADGAEDEAEVADDAEDEAEDDDDAEDDDVDEDDAEDDDEDEDDAENENEDEAADEDENEDADYEDDVEDEDEDDTDNNRTDPRERENADLRRQLQKKDAEIRDLKENKNGWGTVLGWVTGALAIGGAAVYVATRPPPKK